MRFKTPQLSHLVMALTLSVALVTPMFSQTATGTILGTVRDARGALLANAQVKVRKVDTNVSRNVTTDELGNYTVPLLAPGSYQITSELKGFKQAIRSGVQLQVDESARVDIKLEPGEIRFAVTVTADAPMVEADSSALGVVVDGHKIDQLPLNGRDFFQLAYLVPGAVFGAEGSQNMTQGGSVSVHGMREQMNNFLLDGVDNNDQFLNQVSVPPPLDSVQEFKVQSGVYNAEFGSRSGAQLNFVTRSGSNRLRLSLYEYHRNAALDAKNFFDPSDREIPKFIRNQFGFSMGGPIVHDKTFFLGHPVNGEVERGSALSGSQIWFPVRLSI